MSNQPTPKATSNPQEQAFIHLNMRSIQADKPADLQFIIVNETLQLTHYRQAAFFNVRANGKPYLTTASGLVSVTENSPYSVWLNTIAKQFNQTQISVLSLKDVSVDLQEGWQEWLPEHVLTIPLKSKQNQPVGLVMYAREKAWSEQEVGVLSHIHETYGYCLGALKNSKRSFSSKLGSVFKLKFWLLGLAGFVALMFLPVRLSTLAPAEVIALNALSVAAPQDGVIHKFIVQPNALVKKGDVLFTLDNTAISNRLEVAASALSIAKADALVAEQRAFDDAKGKAELASSLGRVREKEAELASVKATAERVEVVAEQDGIAIFTDANDWIGKPVQTGERVMQIADPQQAGLLMWLPVRDALNLDKGAPMKLFLHTQPLKPIAASLQQTSYSASLSPENVASYRLKGTFDDTAALPRIGLRGTARISGEWSILGYYLFRRPIAAVREWTGW